MPRAFKIGDCVSWNSGAGRVSGTGTSKTDHTALHKTSALSMHNA